MAKDKKGKKDRNDKKLEKFKKDNKIGSGESSPSAESESLIGGQTYADGHPLDRVQYLEAKLILKPDRFISVQSFRDFGKLVQRSAKKAGVGFIADPKTGLRPETREIVFIDTPDFRLYNNAFILRRRITYVDGFAEGDPEIVFKFRHPDESPGHSHGRQAEYCRELSHQVQGGSLAAQERGGRVSPSVFAQLSVRLEPDARCGQNLDGYVGHVFPALAALKKSDDEHVGLVNEGIVEEFCCLWGNWTSAKEC